MTGCEHSAIAPCGLCQMRAEIDRLWAVNETLRKLVRRYRDETPLGHQPHMIAHQVDATLGAYEPKEPG